MSHVTAKNSSIRADEPPDMTEAFESLLQTELPADDPPQTRQPGGLPSIGPEETRVSSYLHQEPAPREYLATLNGEPFLPKGIVGANAGTGGTGKSMLTFHFAHCGSHGEPFGPIEFPRKLTILILAAEDDQAEVDSRSWKITKGRIAEGLHVAALPGLIGPLMEMDAAGNPRRSKWLNWLEGELAKYNGTLDILILDPYSRFYGLSENLNEHATAFVTALEYLRDKYGITILITVHTNKGSSDNPPERMEQSMLRGASALVDGVRWVLGMRHMIEKTAKKLNVENRFEWVEVDLVKTNYSAKPSRPFYLRKNSDGTLDPGSPAAGRLEGMARALVEVLADELMQYTVRDIEKNEVGKAVEDKVKERAPGFSRRKDTRACIEFAASRGWVEVVEVPGGRGSTAQKIVILSRN